MWLGSHIAVTVTVYMHRPIAAALIRPLAQELPYTIGVAVKRKKKSFLIAVCTYEVTLDIFFIMI